jgi:hypothetical protein
MLPQMQLALPGFRKVPGLSFYKLMGSGGENGFSIRPNWGVYALLCVWDAEAYADQFFQHGSHFRKFRKHATNIWTVFMHNQVAHGLWSGKNPFRDFQAPETGPVAVITRATIKPRFLAAFWKYVPPVSKQIEDHPGKIFSIGIGEYPLFMQATFSIWQDRESMIQYAYKSPMHRDVIKKTRELGWYQEELFANFIPYRTEGSWQGVGPLTLKPA